VTTRQLRLARPLPLRNAPVVAAVVLGVPAAAGLGAVVALHPEWWRALLAAALVLNGIVVAMKWPRAAAIATLLWLPFLALVRRLLISETSWTQQDPLLLVGPVVALFLCYRLFVMERRELAPDLLSKLVLILLGFAVFGAVNPFGVGGLLGGLGGLLFLGVPLLWFFIGRELGDRRTVSRLLYAVVFVSIPIAAYGLYQTEFGSMPQWDLDWFDITGFSGVIAGTTISGDTLFRPWGTFASTSEYSGFLSIAVVIGIAMLYHRRPALALAIPPLAVAVFLAGGRSVMALTLITAVVLTALRTRNRVFAFVVVVLGVALVFGAAVTVGPRLDRAAGLSGDAKVDRQVGGLLSPLDPNESTFLTHWESLGNAIAVGFSNPIGLGTGAVNLGARVGDGEDLETDIDIGDAFVGLGLLGGLVFVAIIVLSFKKVFGRYLRSTSPDWLLFATAGVLVVTFGQWLQGGHYAASALTWFLLGFGVRPLQRGRARTAEPGRRSSQYQGLPWSRTRRASQSNGRSSERRGASSRPEPSPAELPRP
jgi:hypothetical protein